MTETDLPLPNAGSLSQQRHCKSRKPGLPNYQNHKLIPITQCILPNGSEAWCLVALACEEALWNEEDLRRNLVRKFRNNCKKLTGATGELADRIHRCIDIDCCIQQSTKSGLLVDSLAEDDEHLKSSSSSADEASER